MPRPVRLALVVAGFALLVAMLCSALQGEHGHPTRGSRTVPTEDPRWDAALSEYRLGRQRADEYQVLEAIEHFTRTLDLVAALGWPPEHTQEVHEVQLRLGLAYHHMGDNLQAERHLTRYAAHFPDDHRVSFLLAGVRGENAK